MKKYWETLESAVKIAKGREKTYDNVKTNFEGICELYHSMTGKTLEPSELAMIMVATKLNRERFKHKKDNIIDCINYLAIALFLKK